MDQEPDVIRQQIDETRSSLTEKLETLEEQVKGTVQGARATVEDTIETVKATVQETVDSVKRNFDVGYQVNRHPWAMTGGSFLAGFILGNLTGNRPAGRGPQEAGGLFYAPPAPARHETAPARSNGSAAAQEARQQAVAAEAKPGLVDHLLLQFDDEIQQVKGMAIGAMVGVVRDLIKQAVPPALARQVEEVMDRATAKMGGKPVAGPVLQETAAPAAEPHHESAFARPKW